MLTFNDGIKIVTPETTGADKNAELKQDEDSGALTMDTS